MTASAAPSVRLVPSPLRSGGLARDRSGMSTDASGAQASAVVEASVALRRLRHAVRSCDAALREQLGAFFWSGRLSERSTFGVLDLRSGRPSACSTSGAVDLRRARPPERSTFTVDRRGLHDTAGRNNHASRNY